MPTAAFSVAPIPEPVSRYQPPLAEAVSTSVSLHSSSSFLWVPESSPRDANAAPERAIVARLATASFAPAIPAGSEAGPTITKSLYMRSNRSTPNPPATNASSAGFACTSSTSASPLRALRSACPVPTATTRTSMPDSAVNRGRIWSSRPEFRVEVVDWTTMNSVAWTTGGGAAAHRPAAARSAAIRALMPSTTSAIPAKPRSAGKITPIGPPERRNGGEIAW